jgi:hypothetical protein
MSKERSATEAQFYVDREKWVDAVFSHPDIRHAEFKVLYFIAKRSNFDNGGSYWSVARIAQECRCSTKTVSEATMKAGKLGLLKIGRTLGRKNFYGPTFFWL